MKKLNSYLKYIKFFLLTFSFLILFITSYTYFDQQPLNKFGGIVIKAYLDHHQENFINAEALLDKNDLNDAIKYLSKYEHIGKGDRIYTLKRNFLRKLCIKLYTKHQNKELLYNTSKWVEMDSRDLSAKMFYLVALKINEKNKANFEIIKKDIEKFKIDDREIFDIYKKEIL